MWVSTEEGIWCYNLPSKSRNIYYVIKTWPIFLKIPFVLLRSLVCWCHETGKIFVHMKFSLYSQLNLYIKNVIHANLLLYIIDEIIINCFTVASQILWYMWYPRTQQSISHISMFLRHIQCTISYTWISTNAHCRQVTNRGTSLSWKFNP